MLIGQRRYLKTERTPLSGVVEKYVLVARYISENVWCAVR